MERRVVQTKSFENEIEKLLEKNKITINDFEEFKKELVIKPKKGSVISGTGGIRKTRLKSASKGKRGGFRICYLDLENKLILILLFVYGKNEQEDLSPAEKKELKQLALEIKNGF